MTAPFSISSDQHCHDWSQFSTVDNDGVNSRLRIILDELERQAATLLKAGGDTMFLGGDLFHVRGKIDPEVLNPTIECFKRICSSGVRVQAIAGNHDLKGQHANKLGNAMQALDEIDGFTAVTEPTLVPHTGVFLIPWIEDLDELRAVALKHADPKLDLIIHAPLNGVIKGLPDLGLDPAEVAAWGYKRVFIGHYHNHQEPEPGVFSIGATTHQTWSDPGTLAGFLMVDDSSVTFHESNAPKFVNIDAISEIDDRVTGNYVRLRLQDVEEDDLLAARRQLEELNCKGFVDHSNKKRPTIRPDASTGRNVTLEVSVANYVGKGLQGYENLSKKRIAKEALEVLSSARQVGDE